MGKSLLVGLLVVLGTLLGACGAATPDAPAAAPPSSSTSSVPDSTASPSVTPRPPAPTAAELKKALVTARDLGDPWVQPKSVSTSKGKKGELCPGHVSATGTLPARPEAGANFTEGKGDGKNIASFELSTATDAQSAALRSAYAQDQKACATYVDGSGFHVVRSVEGPASVSGADEVLGTWAERIYYDKAHKKLAYARHYLVLRTGDVVTYVSYAFLTEKKDPKAEDFSRTTALAERQLTKNVAVLR
jgi:hypothetical protein